MASSKTTLQKILEKYKNQSSSKRDKGERFERLMQAYLKTDPKYANHFKAVWLWNEFPYRESLSSTDAGIDIVALTDDGEYWAVQCKFFKEDSYIQKADVDSFLTTSSRSFKDENNTTLKFSQRLWISTTNRWSSNATEVMQNQTPPVARLNFSELEQSPVDWEKIDQGIYGEQARTEKKILRPHQQEALEKAHLYYKTHDRGKMIMACGTGKTFTSLRIAEHETKQKGTILFLVPSIALLGQTLREWSSDAEHPINPVCICSDPRISRKKIKNDDNDTFSTLDLALPASTDTKVITHNFQKIKNKKGMTVVFSTYQSIDVIAKAQKELIKNGFDEFDLIICDEAHRTTGVTLEGADESAFVKVHDNNFIKAKKRLYMTATPRLYSDDSKSKATQADAVLASMDDDSLYGEDFYHIGFGEAVEKGLLTDYKVLILTLNDEDVPPAVQKMIAAGETEVNTDDASKLIGCVNALSKQFYGDNGITKTEDPLPMQRAVAFCQNIKISKQIANGFNDIGKVYADSVSLSNKALLKKQEQMVTAKAKHMDGSMGAPQRDELLSWLKSNPSHQGECKIITNVKVLSEGVDVPSLDAVMFLSARNSQVDVVQSVGRVMRRAEGKKYGYIVIPIVVPSNIKPEEALNDNKNYKVVWTVLNALRAHDDRFNATVNKIDLNKRKPPQITIGRPLRDSDNDGDNVHEKDSRYGNDSQSSAAQRQLQFQFEQLQSVIYARMVEKVGDRKYWEQWAKDVALIADRQIERIANLVENNNKQKEAFENFLLGLQKNINPAIHKEEAIEMLAQHIITKPIFEALFEGYSFEKHNAVSVAMQNMLTLLEGNSLAAESQALQKFYDSVRRRAEGIDNAQGKQRIVIELYDKFFETAFPKMVKQLGIVYTPIEVVDFMIHSVNYVLEKEFSRTLSDENIHVLDPFTGTGTFITRLLQSGLIQEKDLPRKYQHEIHANEIVLLAYYIAAVNIENAYHDILKQSHYTSFEGVVLTDTFQLGESEEGEKLFSEMFPQNSKRVEKQRKTPLRVIMSNPPYSVGQKSANDNAQNQDYPKLEQRIRETYVAGSEASLNKSTYDSYIKAFRWSSDRLDPQHGGVIALVTNGGWLDGNSMDGFRKTLEQEFSSIYVLNLRGSAISSGDYRKKEGDGIFGEGSKTPVVVTLLVKQASKKTPQKQTAKAKIYYHDIGDYLTREQKLQAIQGFGDMAKIPWKKLNPNQFGDWINQRSDLFGTFISIGDKKGNEREKSFFVPLYSNGVKTNRDPWVYNFNKQSLSENMKESIRLYMEGLNDFITRSKGKNKPKADDYIDFSQKMISWTREIKWDIEKGKEYRYEPNCLTYGSYRPFTKQNLYFNSGWNNTQYQIPKLFPDKFLRNKVICLPAPGGTKDFSTIITDLIPDIHMNGDTQCFPLYYYEKQDGAYLKDNMFNDSQESEYIRKDGVSGFVWQKAKSQYQKDVTKEDIFYYVYGFLHSPEYRTAFADDLKKMLPRLWLVKNEKDFWTFCQAGRDLAALHLDYENVPPCSQVETSGMDSNFFTVEKMRFAKEGKETRKDKIVYNSQIMLSNIPLKAYQYVVNGKSAIEWVMENYQVKIDKKSGSGIKNNPNDWAKEQNKPRYILDLLLSVINLSVQTVDIVESLPKLEIEGE